MPLNCADFLPSEILKGMDAAQMDETLTEHHWADEAEYKAINIKGRVALD